MSSRYVGVVVPSFSVAAVRRTRPELRDRPLAVTVGQPQAVVFDADERARRLGINPGMSADEAAVHASELTLCARDGAGERTAQDALLDAALAVSPRVESVAPGIVCLDLAGLHALHPTEPRLAEDLAARAADVGLPARVGIASTRTAARLAAMQRITVIPDGREAAALAPLAIDLLAPTMDLAAVLDRWGVRTLGQLAALPDRALIERLGREGRRLQRLARGEDVDPFVPFHQPPVWNEAIDLEWPIERVEALTFVLGGLVDRLAARLACRGWAVGSVRLSATLADGSCKTYPLALVAPCADGRAILPLLVRMIEADPPPAAIVRLSAQAEPATVRLAQGALFAPSAVSPERLATTLARLEALVGSDRVGSPALLDTHRPDAFVMMAFGKEGETSSKSRRHKSDSTAEARNRRNRVPILRRFRPPVGIEVETAAEGTPLRILGGPWKSTVRVAAGPWRSSGEWWGETAWTTDEWDVELASGCVARLAFNPHRWTWVVNGVYD